MSRKYGSNERSAVSDTPSTSGRRLTFGCEEHLPGGARNPAPQGEHEDDHHRDPHEGNQHPQGSAGRTFGGNLHWLLNAQTSLSKGPKRPKCHARGTLFDRNLRNSSRNPGQVALPVFSVRSDAVVSQNLGVRGGSQFLGGRVRGPPRNRTRNARSARA